MRRGSSPSLISKNRYLYHQKDKPINEMAAFFRSCPARRPKKPKAERLLYHFVKLQSGGISDLDVSESYAVLLVHHPSIIFRKRGITPDGFLLVVLLPKGTNGISKCQIRQRIGYKEDVTKTDDDTEPGIPRKPVPTARAEENGSAFPLSVYSNRRGRSEAGMNLPRKSISNHSARMAPGVSFFFFSGEVRFIRRM